MVVIWHSSNSTPSSLWPHLLSDPSFCICLHLLRFDSILKDFNACQVQGCRCRQEPRSSQFSEVLHVHNWSVTYAPDPQNVRWYVQKLHPPKHHQISNTCTCHPQLMCLGSSLREHLSLGGISWWIRCFIINCILFILLFFLTTPAIIISTMDKFNVTKPVEYLNVRNLDRLLVKLSRSSAVLACLLRCSDLLLCACACVCACMRACVCACDVLNRIPSSLSSSPLCCSGLSLLCYPPLSTTLPSSKPTGPGSTAAFSSPLSSSILQNSISITMHQYCKINTFGWYRDFCESDKVSRQSRQLNTESVGNITDSSHLSPTSVSTSTYNVEPVKCWFDVCTLINLQVWRKQDYDA